jgi:hypothetical protein
MRHSKHEHIVGDIHHCLRTPGFANAVLRSTHDHNGLWISILKAFIFCQQMNPQLRHRLRHVEHESDAWVHAFDAELQFAELQLELIGGITAIPRPCDHRYTLAVGAPRAFAPLTIEECRHAVGAGQAQLMNFVLSSLVTEARLDAIKRPAIAGSMRLLASSKVRIPLSSFVANGADRTPGSPTGAPSAKRASVEGAPGLVIQHPADRAVILPHLTEFGTFGCFPALPYRDVASEKVSLHNPLHRMLVGVIEYIVRSTVMDLQISTGPEDATSLCAIEDHISLLNGSTARRMCTAHVCPGASSGRVNVRVSCKPETMLSAGNMQTLRDRATELRAHLQEGAQSSLDALGMIADTVDSPVLTALLLLEHPLRAMCAVVQAKAGLWVRNGQSFAAQLQNYTGAPQSLHFLDPDIKVAQLSCLMLSPQHFIDLFIHRCGLRGWLLPDVDIVGTNAAWHQFRSGLATRGDDSTLPEFESAVFTDELADVRSVSAGCNSVEEQLAIIPEALKLLCIIATELPVDPLGVRQAPLRSFNDLQGTRAQALHSKGDAVLFLQELELSNSETPSQPSLETTPLPAWLNDMSVTRQPTDNFDMAQKATLRRELLHLLAAEPQPWSGLVKAAAIVYRRQKKVDEEAITACLADIADYRAPTGMDSGVYTLKDALLEEYDQYFRHLNSKMHIKARERWLAKRKNAKPQRSLLIDLEQAQPIAPAPHPCISSYAGVRNILHAVASVYFVKKVVTSSLSNDAARCSDGSLTAALHFLTLALHTLPSQHAPREYRDGDTNVSVFCAALLAKAVILPYGGPASRMPIGTTSEPSASTSTPLGWASKFAAGFAAALSDGSTKRKREGIAEDATSADVDAWLLQDASLRDGLLQDHAGASLFELLYRIYKRSDASDEIRDGAAWCLSKIRVCSAECAAAFDALLGEDLNSAATAERAAAEATRKAELEARKKAAQARAMAAMAKQQASVLNKMGGSPSDDLVETSAPLQVDGAAMHELQEILDSTLNSTFGAPAAPDLEAPAAVCVDDACILCGEVDNIKAKVHLAFAEASTVALYSSQQACIARATALENVGLSTLPREEWVARYGVSQEQVDAASASLSEDLGRKLRNAVSGGPVPAVERILPAPDDPLRQFTFFPLSSDVGVALHLCGHKVHSDCVHKYLLSTAERARMGMVAEGAHNLKYENGEFMCPLCRNLCNVLVPDQAPLWPSQWGSSAACVSNFMASCCSAAGLPASTEGIRQLAKRFFCPVAPSAVSSTAWRCITRAGLHEDWYSFVCRLSPGADRTTLRGNLQVLCNLLKLDVTLQHVPVADNVAAQPGSAEEAPRELGLWSICRRLLHFGDSFTTTLLEHAGAPRSTLLGAANTPSQLMVAALSSFAYTLHSETFRLASPTEMTSCWPTELAPACTDAENSKLLLKQKSGFQATLAVVTQCARLLAPPVGKLGDKHQVAALSQLLLKLVPTETAGTLPVSFLPPQRQQVFGTSPTAPAASLIALITWLEAASLSAAAATECVTHGSERLPPAPLPQAATTHAGPTADHGLEQFLMGDDVEIADDDGEDDDSAPGMMLNLDGYNGGTFMDDDGGGEDEEDGDDADDGEEEEEEEMGGLAGLPEEAGLAIPDAITPQALAAAGITPQNLLEMLQNAMNGPDAAGAMTNMLSLLAAATPGAAPEVVTPPLAVSGPAPAQSWGDFFVVDTPEYEPCMHNPVHFLLANLLTEGSAPLQSGNAERRSALVDFTAFLVSGTSATAVTPEACISEPSRLHTDLHGDVGAAIRLVSHLPELPLSHVNPIRFVLLSFAACMTEKHSMHFMCLGYLLALSHAAALHASGTHLDVTLQRGVLPYLRFVAAMNSLQEGSERLQVAFQGFVSSVTDMLVMEEGGDLPSDDSLTTEGALFLRVCLRNRTLDASSFRLARWAVHTRVASSLQSGGVKTAAPSNKLVDLPESYDVVYARLAEAKCDVCHSRPPQAAICLICGIMVCAGADCCRFGGPSTPGECTRHAALCGAGTGVFLLAHSSQVLLIRGIYSAYYPSPYVDAHGEQDPGLRRGKPLHLSEHRYAVLNELWLHHQVAREVSRQRNSADMVIRTAFY